MEKKFRKKDDILSMFFTMSDIIKNGFYSQLPKLCTLSQLRILALVFKKYNPSMKNIADEFGVTPPAATLITDKLVEGRFLKRVVDKKDRRFVRLKITPKGRNILKVSLIRVRNILAERTSFLTKEEKIRLIYLLQKIINN